MQLVRAFVVSNRAHGEQGRRVQLLSEDVGTETLFLSSRRQYQKLQGLLSFGSIIRCERSKIRGKSRLMPIRVDYMVKRATTDLDVFHYLSYALEIGRNLGRETALESHSFALFMELATRLEEHGAHPFRLFTWQLALLSSIGMPLAPWPCQVSGGKPDGISLSHGGAVSLATVPTAFPLSMRALRSLNFAWLSEYEQVQIADKDELHRAFVKIWRELFGQELRSAIYLS